MDAEKQRSDKTIFEVVTFNKNIIGSLTEKSNKMFENLKRRGFINLLTFVDLIVNSCNLGKLYFLPKIHKRLSSAPERPVICNCGTPTEKVSKLLCKNNFVCNEKQLV